VIYIPFKSENKKAFALPQRLIFFMAVGAKLI